jgi:hypothetical protein
MIRPAGCWRSAFQYPYSTGPLSQPPLHGPDQPLDVRLHVYRPWLWCNRGAFGDDGRMPQFVPVEELFKGRHFDREIVVLCVRWHLSFKQLSRLGSYDERTGRRHGPHDNSEVGATFHAGIREALETVRSPHRRILANGRDQHKGTRRMDVPVSGGGQSREDGRFPSEPEARRERGEGLSAQGREGSADPREKSPWAPTPPHTGRWRS